MDGEIRHDDSDLLDDIFAPTSVAGKTSKFKPKPRITNKKVLDPSKSDAEGPSSSSKSFETADSKCPVEELSGSIVQNLEESHEYSKCSNVHDMPSQLSGGEPEHCTDKSECLGSGDVCNKRSSISASILHMPDLIDDFSHQANRIETMHCVSDLVDDIFAPATVLEKTGKFKPKPHIVNKKTLPKPSKSDPAEGPSPSSTFPPAADSKGPVEGSDGPYSGLPCSSVSSDTHLVAQKTQKKIESSISNTVLDTISRLGTGESKQCTDIPCCLEVLSSCNRNSTLLEPVNPARSGSDVVDVLMKGDNSMVESSLTELNASVNQPGILGQNVEPMQIGANAYEPFVDVQNFEETTAFASLGGFDDSISGINCSSERPKGKFRPKPCRTIIKQSPASLDSSRTASEGLETSALSCVPETISKAADQFVGLEMLDGDIKLTSTTVVSRPIFTSNLGSSDSEPISVSPELEITRCSVTEGFATNVEPSHLSQRVVNLQRSCVEVGEPTTIHSSVVPAHDLFLQSDQPIVKSIGKFRPKSSLRVKEGKNPKSVSFVLSDDGGESFASVEGKPELVMAYPIERITSVVESSENLGLLLVCGKDNQVDCTNLVRQNVADIASLDPISEPICNSVELVETHKTDLQCSVSSAEAISVNSTGLNDSGSSDLDSLHSKLVATCQSITQVNAASEYSKLDSLPIHSDGLNDSRSSDLDSLYIQSVATCTASISQAASEYSQLGSLSIHSEILNDHGSEVYADGLIGSLAMKEQNRFLNKTSEELAYTGKYNDLVDQSVVENEYLCSMEEEQIIDHNEGPNLDECVSNIVQSHEDETSSKRARQRKRKLKSGTVDNVVNEDQNSIDMMSAVDDDYHGDCDRNVPGKKKREGTRKSSNKNGEKEGSTKKSKKASVNSDSVPMDPPTKRLPHGSRSKNSKRQVNKALLGIPDDELDRKQIAIRDLIRLAGFKERISNKEATVLRNPLANQSEEHEQDPDVDDANRDIQADCPKLNYHSYMKRPQQIRWSNTETELFYQAVGQFGTDFAMIQVLFPNRSRQQVKAKFKSEQRKRPLEIADAVVYRSRDHSQFEKVIQHLQEVAENKSKSNPCDSPVKSEEAADQNEQDYHQEEGIEALSKDEENENYYE